MAALQSRIRSAAQQASAAAPAGSNDSGAANSSVDGNPPLVEFVSAQSIRERSLQIFDRSFAVTYWLQAVAIGIGLFGVAASFSAQVLARRKEFGLLAHLGLTRRQILAVVAGRRRGVDGHWCHRWRAAGPGCVRRAGARGQPAELSLDDGDEHPAARLWALCAAVVVSGTVTAWLAGRAAAGRMR